MTQHVARYRLLSALARGGAGEVYRAEGPDGAQVALKVLRGPFTERRQRRAELEVRALEKLQHPAILPLLDHGWEQGCAYLVFPLVEAGSLQDRIKREGPLSEDAARRLVRALAEGLEHAHAHGVLHRDLKPDNVLLTPDGPRLIDFGLALELEASYSRLTVSGTFLGTPGFWAPEQAQGELERTGPWTDVYGLGATLYACLTGRPPFVAASVGELLSLVVQKATPAPPSALRPGLDPALAALCLDCMAHELEERPTLAAVRARLQEGGPPARAPRWGLLPWVALPALATAALAGALWFTRDAPHAAPAPAVEPADAPSAREAQALALCTLSAEVNTVGVPALSEAYAEAAIRLAPERGLPWFRRGNARYLQRRYQAAADDYGRALQLGLPDLADGFLNLGSALRRLGRLDEAKATYEAGLVLDPDFGQLLNQLAGMAMDAGDHAEAIATYTRALEADPSPLSLINRGTCYLKAERYPEAIADLEQATAEAEAAGLAGSDTALAYENLGLARIYQREDLAGAIAATERACELEPTPGRYARLAHALKLDEQLERGIEVLGRALELDPGYALAYANRADLERDLELLEPALADSLRAVELAPEDPRFWETRGRVLANAGHDERAIRAYDRSLELRPDDLSVLHNRGSAKGREGDYAGAVEDYSRVLELAPSNWQTRFTRTFAYAGLGRLEEARADLRVLIERAPPEWTRPARERLQELGE
ncbi:MAG: protein kinase [Planctomycetota bacterium]